MGSGGKRSYGHVVPVGRVPRRSFGFFPIAGKETRRPQAAKLPCANNTSKAARRGRRALHKKPLYHRPLIRHGFAVPPFPIPSVASRHLPLTRGVGPRGEGFLGGLSPHPSGLRPATFPQGEGLLGGQAEKCSPNLYLSTTKKRRQYNEQTCTASPPWTPPSSRPARFYWPRGAARRRSRSTAL